MPPSSSGLYRSQARHRRLHYARPSYVPYDPAALTADAERKEGTGLRSSTTPMCEWRSQSQEEVRDDLACPSFQKLLRRRQGEELGGRGPQARFGWALRTGPGEATRGTRREEGRCGHGRGGGDSDGGRFGRQGSVGEIRGDEEDGGKATGSRHLSYSFAPMSTSLIPSSPAPRDNSDGAGDKAVRIWGGAAFGGPLTGHTDAKTDQFDNSTKADRSKQAVISVRIAAESLDEGCVKLKPNLWNRPDAEKTLSVTDQKIETERFRRTGDAGDITLYEEACPANAPLHCSSFHNLAIERFQPRGVICDLNIAITHCEALIASPANTTDAERLNPLPTPNITVDPDTAQPPRAKVGSVEGGTESTVYDRNEGMLVSRSPADEFTPASSSIKASTKIMNGLALLTIVYAGTAAQILRAIRADDKLKDVTGGVPMTALNFASYAAIVFNLLVVAASVCTAHQLRRIARNEMRGGGNRPTGNSVFGARRLGQFLFKLAMLCAVLGFLLLYSELLIYALLRGGLAAGLVLVGLMVSAMAVLACALTFVRRPIGCKDEV
ncbi:hypothetical protein GGX14DRAFT_384836 [Mycena pura]|uniref:Uncharacterized protein n=1 Tax=Mycena pura TaxID=153505 RepID=A0AAD6YT06_9AGAR|nr:hypothetical protein GGX14DRAFT_384836 [Mycena pura]